MLLQTKAIVLLLTCVLAIVATFIQVQLFHQCLLLPLVHASCQRTYLLYRNWPDACKAFVNAIWSVSRFNHSLNLSIFGYSPIQLLTKIPNLSWLSTDLMISLMLRLSDQSSLLPSDLVSSGVAETALDDTPLFWCWQVPRTLANSLWYWVKDTVGICSSNALAIDALLWSYSWLAYRCFMVLSRFTLKSGFLLITFLANSCNSSAKDSSDSLAYWHLL